MPHHEWTRNVGQRYGLPRPISVDTGKVPNDPRDDKNEAADVGGDGKGGGPGIGEVRDAPASGGASDVLASAEWLRMLYATVACGVVVLDGAGRVVDANAAAHGMLGAGQAGLRGARVSDILTMAPRDDPRGGADAQATVWVGLRAGRTQHDLSVGMTRPDGDRLYLHADAVPVVDRAGALEQVVISFVDVTARTLGEERLRLLESVVVHANDAVIITEAWPIDLPGPCIVYTNDAFTRMTGYAADEVRGRTPRLLQGPDADRATLDRLRAAPER